MKKILSVILSFVLLLSSFCVSTYASVPEISPYYLHIRSIGRSFTIDSQTGEARVLADLTISSGDHCSVSASVQKKVNTTWRSFAVFRDSGTEDAGFIEYVALDSGYTYKCVFNFIVYDVNGNIIEQKSFTSEEIYYS
ncbi:MAG: hypothetical protein IJA17_10455 [Oscillospiraceae bacterium]|nr:hypothetical protein [Oscillospiraceae bacterium]